ncbi:MAG: DUF2975 domain-containing protein [FCB group bacterium]|nr:DUF2975 domain-containing protein [FCB group bacterium]
MTETNDIGKLPSIKAISIVISWFYYLGWVAFGLITILFTVLYITDNNVKFINLPISISYEENLDKIPPDFLNSDSKYQVVGVEKIKLHTNNEGGFSFTLIMPVLLISGLLWILYIIRKFIRTVKEGHPFSRDNPRRIRMIGFIVMISSPVIAAVQYIYAYQYIYMLDFPHAEIRVEPDISLMTIFLGLILFVIGHVYELGVKLKEENDLTI